MRTAWTARAGAVSAAVAVLILAALLGWGEAGSSTRAFVLTPSSWDAGADAAVTAAVTPTLPAPAVPISPLAPPTPEAVSICIQAYHDRNEDTFWQAGPEEPVAGAVFLVGNATGLLGEYTTDGRDEPICLAGLAPGVYRIVMLPPPGLAPSGPSETNLAAGGPGELEVAFGLLGQPSVEGAGAQGAGAEEGEAEGGAVPRWMVFAGGALLLLVGGAIVLSRRPQRAVLPGFLLSALERMRARFAFPPLVRFLVRRALQVPLTFVIVTALLYGVLAMAPAETRAHLYLPHWQAATGGPNLLRTIIAQHGLDAPYPVQYLRWLGQLLRGDWGWSSVLREDILEALVERTPATAELTLYSLLFFIPLGLASGIIAAWKRGRLADNAFRLVAFAATSVPPFVLALVLLAIFYIGLQWFPPGRLGTAAARIVDSSSFGTYTGLLTVDGLLNGELSVTLDALRHLALPALTLSLAHWATLGRVTRAAMIEELDKEYVVAARGRGLSMGRAVWRHALRNAALPGINSSALSAASLVTGVFIVEIIFNYPGVSKLMTNVLTLREIYGFGFDMVATDMAATMGFAVYSILVVLPMMFVLDVLQAIVDPRIREGIIGR